MLDYKFVKLRCKKINKDLKSLYRTHVVTLSESLDTHGNGLWISGRAVYGISLEN